MIWNVIWSYGQQEVAVLTRVSRELALQFIETYYSAFEKRSVYVWDLTEGNDYFKVTMEKVG